MGPSFFEWQLYSLKATLAWAQHHSSVNSDVHIQSEQQVFLLGLSVAIWQVGDYIAHLTQYEHIFRGHSAIQFLQPCFLKKHCASSQEGCIPYRSMTNTEFHVQGNKVVVKYASCFFKGIPCLFKKVAPGTKALQVLAATLLPLN